MLTFAKSDSPLFLGSQIKTNLRVLRSFLYFLSDKTWDGNQLRRVNKFREVISCCQLTLVWCGLKETIKVDE